MQEGQNDQVPVLFTSTGTPARDPVAKKEQDYVFEYSCIKPRDDHERHT